MGREKNSQVEAENIRGPNLDQANRKLVNCRPCLDLGFTEPYREKHTILDAHIPCIFFRLQVPLYIQDPSTD